MTVLEKIESYRTLLDALAAAPSERPFATMWVPNREPQYESVSFGEFLAVAHRYANL
jgi:hypothetical protein